MSGPRSMLASATMGSTFLDQKKIWLRGVIAHLAIQTAYRLQHHGNLVISERSIWVGDTNSSTISKFNEVLDRGITAAQQLAK